MFPDALDGEADGRDGCEGHGAEDAGDTAGIVDVEGGVGEEGVEVEEGVGIRDYALDAAAQPGPSGQAH